MQTLVHRAGERGKGEYGWLSTRYSFSFADWHDPSRMGFGALRVVNDDRIAPLTGFPSHSHRDMEILTIVTEGAVTHEDSAGNRGTVSAGEVQAMSAGTGIVHSEYNRSPDTPLALFQLWVTPRASGGTPRYGQMRYQMPPPGALTTLAGPERLGSGLALKQDAYVHRAALDTAHPFEYALFDSADGVYVFVVSGSVRAAGVELAARDALGVSGTPTLRLEAEGAADILLVEVPMA